MIVVPPELRIAYRHLAPSDALSESVAREFEQLRQLFQVPMTCEVVVERGARFGATDCRVRATLSAHGTTLVADRVTSPDEQADPYSEIREAFRILRRQLARRTQQQAPRSGDRVSDHLPT
jgi:ribosome-associated translation inhibitor RaiA